MSRWLGFAFIVLTALMVAAGLAFVEHSALMNVAMPLGVTTVNRR